MLAPNVFFLCASPLKSWIVLFQRYIALFLPLVVIKITKSSYGEKLLHILHQVCFLKLLAEAFIFSGFITRWSGNFNKLKKGPLIFQNFYQSILSKNIDP